MDIITMMAEQKIQEAMAKGELNNLAYEGKPVEIEDLSNIPEELRMTYRILKNAHILPEEMEIRKEIISLKKLIDCCSDEKEKSLLEGRWNQKILHFNVLMEKRRMSHAVFNQYKSQISNKFR